ncbi:hypothetical protein AB6A23_05795 [Paenibacillus tarimensis]
MYKEKYLFSGDHLYWDRSNRSLGVAKEYCFYSWHEQLKSMERLAEEGFEWVCISTPRGPDFSRGIKDETGNGAIAQAVAFDGIA